MSNMDMPSVVLARDVAKAEETKLPSSHAPESNNPVENLGLPLPAIEVPDGAKQNKVLKTSIRETTAMLIDSKAMQDNELELEGRVDDLTYKTPWKNVEAASWWLPIYRNSCLLEADYAGDITAQNNTFQAADTGLCGQNSLRKYMRMYLCVDCVRADLDVDVWMCGCVDVGMWVCADRGGVVRGRCAGWKYVRVDVYFCRLSLSFGKDYLSLTRGTK